MPIIFPECPIPAGNTGLGVGIVADDFLASPPLASLMLKFWASDSTFSSYCYGPKGEDELGYPIPPLG